MMRVPIPTAREVRGWFIVATAIAFAITGTACWGIAHKVNQSDEIIRIAASSSAQVDRLSDQLDAQAVESARQQRQLKAQNRQVHAELRALLRYLRAHGIEVPQTALTPGAERGGMVTRPKVPGPRPSSQPAPTPSPPESPASTAPPSPTASPGLIALCDLLAVTPCPLP